MPELADAPDRSRFEIRVDGEVAGFSGYRRRPGLIACIHTLTDPHFEGQGLGSELVRTALSQARADGLSVLPFCPFVRAYIARHTEYRRRRPWVLPDGGEAADVVEVVTRCPTGALRTHPRESTRRERPA